MVIRIYEGWTYVRSFVLLFMTIGVSMDLRSLCKEGAEYFIKHRREFFTTFCVSMGLCLLCERWLEGFMKNENPLKSFVPLLMSSGVSMNQSLNVHGIPFKEKGKKTKVRWNIITFIHNSQKFPYHNCWPTSHKLKALNKMATNMVPKFMVLQAWNDNFFHSKRSFIYYWCRD